MDGDKVSFQTRAISTNRFCDIQQAYLACLEPDNKDCYTSTNINQILESKYDPVAVDQVVDQLTQFKSSQQEQLKKLLHKYTKLFSGKLGQYPHCKVHLELNSDTHPRFQQAYPMPHAHHDVFKTELDHLTYLRVLSRCGASEWAAPSLIIPKKDGRFRWIGDFREINKCIKHHIYPLPRIADIQYFSKLDISMQYYTFKLDKPSKKLCVINTPFDLYRYNCLPMGA